MQRKQAKPFWPELPSSRGEIDHVHELFLEWAEWSRLGRDEVENNNVHFLNSAVHVIACALIHLLVPYATRGGTTSEVFQNSYELGCACDGNIFPYGYPQELAEALAVCYSLEMPWELSVDAALKYADELTLRLKDIALYEVDGSSFWKTALEKTKIENEKIGKELKKHRSGRPVGAVSALRIYVEAVVNDRLDRKNYELWKVLCGAVDNDTSRDEIPLAYDCDRKKLYRTSGDCGEYSMRTFNNLMAKLRDKNK